MNQNAAPASTSPAAPFEAFLARIVPLLPGGWGASVQVEDPLTGVVEEVASGGGDAAPRARLLTPALLPEAFTDPPESWRLARAGLAEAKMFPLVGDRPFGRLLLVAPPGAELLGSGVAARVGDLCAESGGELERARARREDEKFTGRLRRMTEGELADRFTEAAVALLPSVPLAAVLAVREGRLTVLLARHRATGTLEALVRRSVPLAGTLVEALAAGRGESLLAPELFARQPEWLLLGDAIAASAPAAVETIPLETRGRLVGGFVLVHDREAARADERLAIGRLAADLSQALDRLRPERRQASSFLYLQEILRAPGRSLASLLANVVDEMIRFLGADAAVLGLVDADTGKLLLSEAKGFTGAPLPESIPLEESKDDRRSIAAQVVRSGEPFLAADTRSSPIYLPADPSIRSEIAVPLRLRGEIFGVALASSRTPGFFGEEDLPRFQLVADQVALAVANARLLDSFRVRREREEARRQRREFGFDPAVHAEELEYHFGNLVGDPAGPMGEVYRAIERVAAREEETVLVVGETGTGKEMVAHAIHRASARRSRAMVPTNVAAMGGDPNLVQSELFGHERGSFTGAATRRRGAFELAHRSTLLIDEVGDVVPSVQVKLLRVLGRSSERSFTRLGGEEEVTSDVRVLAATHRHLPDEVRAGRFREDLYYRLSALVIRLPPLRARPSDVPLLARHVLARAARGETLRLGSGAEQLLMGYHWPGNVRQLESVLLRALVMFARPGSLSPDDLRRALEMEEGWTGEEPAGGGVPACPDPPPPDWFWEHVWKPWKARRLAASQVETLLRRTLQETGGFWSRAAERLGVERKDYTRFLDFLSNAGVKIDHRPYRGGNAGR